MIRVDFRGFWPGFNYKDNLFFNYLIENQALVVDPHDPDIIIYSDYYDSEDIDMTQKKILYSPENVVKDDAIFKFTMSHHPNSYNNFRFQNFFYYPYFMEMAQASESKDLESLRYKKKTRHINFIYSNHRDRLRNDYFKYINNFYKVDSYGRYKNNMGPIAQPKDDLLSSRALQKIALITNYKFTISFENSPGPNYISEKIWEPLCVNSIPIYFGNKAIFDYFNKDRIIYISDRKDFSKSISVIKEIDSSKNVYDQYVSGSIFKDEETRIKLTYASIAKNFFFFLERVMLDDALVRYKTLKKIRYYLLKGYYHFS
jgi:hypothetical protein